MMSLKQSSTFDSTRKSSSPNTFHPMKIKIKTRKSKTPTCETKSYPCERAKPKPTSPNKIIPKLKGFPARPLWTKLNSTRKDPKQTSSYFLKEKKGNSNDLKFFSRTIEKILHEDGREKPYVKQRTCELVWPNLFKKANREVVVRPHLQACLKQEKLELKPKVKNAAELPRSQTADIKYRSRKSPVNNK